MLTNDFDLMTLISSIGNLDDNNDRILYYELNQHHLKDYSMIFVDDKFGLDKTQYLNTIAELDYDYNSLFFSNKLLCINSMVLKNKSKHLDTLLKNQVIATFDLNIISQLKYCNLNDNVLDKVIDLCKSGGCSFDAMNFVIENFMKNKNNIGLDNFAIEDLRAFESMFPYKRSKYDRGMYIEKRMSLLLKSYNNKNFIQFVHYLYDTIYLHELTFLLAIVYIHFQYSNLSPKHKFDKFLEYCNHTIQAFSPCANNLAKMFYENTNLKFFKKIQKNNNNLINNIENMAWDLFHLRYLEKINEFNNKRDIICIPIFISKDKGLNEIRKAYQIKCMFKNNLNNQCLCYYQMNSIDDANYFNYFKIKNIYGRIQKDHDFKDLSTRIKTQILNLLHS